MTTTNNAMDFVFRKKFEKLLNEENRAAITEAFESFCAQGEQAARYLLWKLPNKIDEIKAEELDVWVNIVTEQLALLNLNLDIIPFEQIPLLRNELRYQYELRTPDFLSVNISSDYQNAYTALVNHTDAVVASIVHDKCMTKLYLEKSYLNRILGLLSNNWEKNYFGGLRELKFNYEEACYLKRHHGLIHDLLKAMLEHKEKSERSSMKLPLANYRKSCEEAGIELPLEVEKPAEPKKIPQTSAEKPEEAAPAEEKETDTRTVSENSSHGFKPLTVENILAHQDVFATFVLEDNMNSLVQVAQLGFDLNEVMVNSEKIHNLLIAAQAFNA